MKIYDVSTDKTIDRSIFYAVYYYTRRWWFIRKVFVTRKLIKYAGLGVMQEILQGRQYTAYKMFSGLTVSRKGKFESFRMRQFQED